MPPAETSAPPSEPPHFEALITPHRAMGSRGLRRVVLLILLLSSTVSTALWVLGAWPAVLLNVLEIGLAVFLLLRHSQDRTGTERLVLDAGGIRIRRVGRRGRVEDRRLDSGWLQAILEERPGRTPALLLVERGRKVEIGAALGEAEKRDLAGALRTALHRLRNPVFDNAQLAEHRPAEPGG